MDSFNFPVLFTTAETLNILGISRPLLNKLVTKGDIPIVKIGSKWRFRKEDLATFLTKGSSK